MGDVDHKKLAEELHALQKSDPTPPPRRETQEVEVQKPNGSRAWLKDNLTMLILITAAIGALGTLGGTFLVSAGTFESHKSSMTPHPQKEASETLKQKSRDDRMWRVEQWMTRVPDMIEAGAPPSRKDAVRAIANQPLPPAPQE